MLHKHPDSHLHEQGKPVRVVLVSSLGHWLGEPDAEDLLCQAKPISGAQLYFNAKLLNILFAKELARRCVRC